MNEILDLLQGLGVDLGLVVTAAVALAMIGFGAWLALRLSRRVIGGGVRTYTAKGRKVRHAA